MLLAAGNQGAEQGSNTEGFVYVVGRLGLRDAFRSREGKVYAMDQRAVLDHLHLLSSIGVGTFLFHLLDYLRFLNQSNCAGGQVAIGGMYHVALQFHTGGYPARTRVP